MAPGFDFPETNCCVNKFSRFLFYNSTPITLLVFSSPKSPPLSSPLFNSFLFRFGLTFFFFFCIKFQSFWNLATGFNWMPMGAEKKLGERKGKAVSESKRGRRRHKRLLPVQDLYNTCEQVFADCGPGIVPSPDKIQRLKSVLDSIGGADVGVNPNMPFFREQETAGFPTITYLHIHECDRFSIGIFCLPPSAVIPLHNHPEMTVFSKLLFGTMHIKSYDWVNGVPTNQVPDVNSSTTASGAVSAEARLAKINVDTDYTAPCDTSILYPTEGGNMHCFTAVTQCAVLDVLGPPYDDSAGRHCAYYIEHPFDRISADGISIPEEEREGYAWLQEREKPEGLTVYGVPYGGPAIAK